MKAEFLNPFVYAVLRVLSSEAGLKKSVPGKPFLIRADSTLHAVNVVIGVVGAVQGLVVYGMDLFMAKGIIKGMAGVELPITDPLAESALSELANLVTGVASGNLESAGYPCRVLPPVMVKGTGVKITTLSFPMVAVPIATELGEMRIYLGLNEQAATVGAARR